MGSPWPTLQTGMQFNAAYKQFNVNIQLVGVFGYQIYNDVRKIIDGYRMPVFSPNGQLIAARYDEESGTNDVAIFSVDGGAPLQHVPIPILEWQRVQWIDDQTLSYINTVNGASNLYSYNLYTGVRKQLTFFESDQIVAYAWSPDFTRVACQRVTNIGDVIIISSER